MSLKKQLFISFCGIFLLLAAVSALHFYITNLRRYNLVDFLPEREYIADIARWHNYDSVFLGTSLSECFKCSEFDKYFGVHSHKFTMAGSHISEIAYVAEYAMKYHRIKIAVMDLFSGSFSRAEKVADSFPKEYYQNNSFLTEFRDSVGIDALNRNLKYLRDARKKSSSFVTRDTLFSWAGIFPCGKYFLAQSVIQFKKKESSPAARTKELGIFDKNLRTYLLPIIRKHPDTKFIFFLPPFHILESFMVDNAVQYRKIFMDELLKYKNVELYDFQSVAEICCNSERYKDVFHYHESVNSWMLRQFKNRKYLVTAENRAQYEKAFVQFCQSADPDKIRADFAEYVKEINKKLKK